MTTHTVRVDGLEVAYTDTGTGSTMMFVHGVYVTGALWTDVVTGIRAGLPLHRPDVASRRT